MRTLLPALALALSLALAFLSGPASAQDALAELPLPRSLALVTANLADKTRTLARRASQAPQGSQAAREAALGLGVCQAMAKNYREAAATLAPLVQAMPEMADWVRLFLGLCRLKTGELQAALDLLDPPLADPAAGDGLPPAQDAALLAGYCLEGLGRPAEALGRYQRFLQGRDQTLRPVALWRVAVCMAAAKDYSGAEKALVEVVQQHPWTASAEKAMPLARELAAAGLAAFTPDSPEAVAARARLLLDKGMQAKALPVIEQLAATPGADPVLARYLKGRALYAKRDTQAALALFESVVAQAPGHPLAPWAMHHQARCLWRSGSPDDARQMEELLIAARARAAGDRELAESAGRILMLARLERARFAEAAQAARELAQSNPPSAEVAAQAVWIQGVAAFAQGDLPQARAAFEAYLARNPQDDSLPGALYWLGRTAQAAGQDAVAQEQAAGYFARVVAEQPNGYYATLAAARLADMGRTPPPAAPSGACPSGRPAPAAGQAALALGRAAVFEACLLPELAERDLAAYAAANPREAALALRYAALASALGNHQSAVRAVSRTFADCLAKGDPGELAPLREIYYPRRYADLLALQLAGSGVDTGLLCGLIRQESFFEPDAVSGAGAVGLMQVMPATAKNMAAQMGDKSITPDRLKQPEVNIRYGVRFFLDRHREYNGNLAFTLASYNAGRVKLTVWTENLGRLEQDLFTECIPYTETRDYVKRILANRAMYQRLY